MPAGGSSGTEQRGAAGENRSTTGADNMVHETGEVPSKAERRRAAGVSRQCAPSIVRSRRPGTGRRMESV